MHCSPVKVKLSEKEKSNAFNQNEPEQAQSLHLPKLLMMPVVKHIRVEGSESK
jgi:hypothetical protein